MDDRPGQNQPDPSEIEFEIADLDAGEASDRSARPSRFETMFPQLAHYTRLWPAFMIFAGCVLLGILLFPAGASFVKQIVPSSATATPPGTSNQFDAAVGSENVTFVMGKQVDAQSIPIAHSSVTAYDTQSGTLLWHTSQSPSSTVAYGLATNLKSQESDVYALRSDGLISLLASRTGQVLWTYQLPSAMTMPFAIEQDDLFLFPGSESTLYAVKDGQLLWHTSEVGNVVAIENGVVYTSNSTQQSYSAINERSGARLWSYVVPGSTKPSSQIFLPLAIENKICYLQTIDNTLLAIQPQGHILWSHQFQDAISLQADVHHLYAVDQLAGTIDVFNLQSGKIEQTYSNEREAMSIKDIQNNLLYIQTNEGIRAVNADTGKIVWQKATHINQPIWVANGVLYVFPLNSTDPLQAINERDGIVLWSGVLKGQLASWNSKVLVLVSSTKRTISVQRLSDGKILWSKRILS